MKPFRAFAAFVLLTSFALALSAQEPGMRVFRFLVLTSASDGFDGKLELVQDARITPDLEKALWRMGPPDMVLDEKDPLAKDLAERPLHKAVLRLQDAHQKTVSEKTMDGPLSRIRFAVLIPGRRAILATTDLSAGFGSYSGPATELLRVGQGQLEPIKARNAATGKVDPIIVAATLKTDWKLVPAIGGQANQKDILEAACRPDFATFKPPETKFWVIYTRFHWDGMQWVAYSRKMHGFWEADGEFPSLAHFPVPAPAKP
jgi:hypothetical protein